ncbi:MAG: M6 family metalloprotease domain-containing protein [Candidatus Eiseniibacteriota bacterium]|nr:MAG: M6 family metalloprotease domain-containing protein [Candidatus Eisenbacteria bacterium]
MDNRGRVIARTGGPSGARGLSVTLGSRLFWGAVVVLTALVLAAPPLQGVPIRPDLVERLREEGRLEGFLESQRRINDSAYERGLNVPSERPLFAGEGRPVSSADTVRLRALVLLVDFYDNQADSLNFSRDYYENLLFGIGQSPWGSFREYYLENSNGRLDVTGAVAGWYRMPELYSFYVAGKRGLGVYPRNAQKMAEDAVRAADWDVNFSNFDNDGPDGIPDSGDDDGNIDALFIVHAGPGFEESLDTNDVHSHRWTLLYPLNVDGILVSSYMMQPENGRTGVFCHEFGHTLGLADLYDRDYSSRGLGGWSLMAYGAWSAFGLRPSHLDAWSKIRVGFVEPLVPSQNLEGVSFPPVEQEPVIYKLWDSGTGGSEYFLVERREKIGFDDYLPGGGLLIYHVDETVVNNDRAFHYRVALEQADGLWNLESNVNVGDAGDPYPGTSDNTVFGYETEPSSIGYGGMDSRVRVFNIAPMGSELTADIWVQQGPQLSVSRFEVVDSTGNLDGNPDPGETVSLKVYLRNDASIAVGVRAILLPHSSSVTMGNDLAYFGTIPLNGEQWSYPSFTFTVSDTVSSDPFGAWFDLNIWSTSGYMTTDSILIGVGDVLGFEDDMESPNGWQHYPVRVGWLDEWHVSDRMAYEGSFSWACAKSDSTGYSPRNAAALETPVVLVGKDARLIFYHWMDAQAETSAASDGGFVEVSSNGSQWEVLEPLGGYPCWLKEQEGLPAGSTGVYSGSSTEWERAEFSLDSYVNSTIRLRFRFVSNSDSLGGEGWYVDSLSVVTSPTPVWIGSLAAEEVDGCVVLSWRAASELGKAPFSVWRSPGLDGTSGMHLVSDEPIVSDQRYEFRDCRVAAGTEYLYWVGVEGSSVLLSGPVAIRVSERTRAAPGLEMVSPNPVTGLLKLLLWLPPGGAEGDVSLIVFDVSGRAVRTLYSSRGAPAEEPVRVEWDTKDYSGTRVSPGVYFVRLQWPRGIVATKVVVLATSDGY